MNTEDTSFEGLVMELIVNAGAAKSGYIEAIRLAREGDCEGAAKAREEAAEAYQQAHELHFKMISEEMEATGATKKLLLIHAEDQLNSAEVFKEISADMAELYRLVHRLTDKVRKETI